MRALVVLLMLTGCASYDVQYGDLHFKAMTTREVTDLVAAKSGDDFYLQVGKASGAGETIKGVLGNYGSLK